MKIGAENRTGFDCFSRLDWPASEFIRDAESARSRPSGEVSQLNWGAAEILREARRARAEAVHRWCRSLLLELRQTVSGSLTAPEQKRGRTAVVSRRR
jgi:hypothetical protein